MWDSKDYYWEPLLYRCFIKCYLGLLNRCNAFICVKPQKRGHLLCLLLTVGLGTDEARCGAVEEGEEASYSQADVCVGGSEV